MSTTYAQKQAPAQKKEASNATSVHDNSSQSESLQRKANLANNDIPIQRYFGLATSHVATNITIRGAGKKKGKKRWETFKQIGAGGSDPATTANVKNIIESCGLTTLANVNRAAGGNPPNQCAEPHAVAEALNQIKKDYSIYTIEKMHFDDAKVLTPWGTHHQGQVMPPCNTCAQWIDNSHNVKDEYKKID